MWFHTSLLQTASSLRVGTSLLSPYAEALVSPGHMKRCRMISEVSREQLRGHLGMTMWSKGKKGPKVIWDHCDFEKRNPECLFLFSRANREWRWFTQCTFCVHHYSLCQLLEYLGQRQEKERAFPGGMGPVTQQGRFRQAWRDGWRTIPPKTWRRSFLSILSFRQSSVVTLAQQSSPRWYWESWGVLTKAQWLTGWLVEHCILLPLFLVQPGPSAKFWRLNPSSLPGISAS